ncbi:MAG: PGPGW domain-containing protein [Phycisphaerales bacterium]
MQANGEVFEGVLEPVLTFAESHQGLLWSVGIASAAVFVASLVAMPWLIALIPADYFAHEQRPPSRWAHLHPVLRFVVFVARNIVGTLLVLAGIAMLMLPGQGILTIVVGFLVLDMPGKYTLERWIVGKRMVHKPLNWIRAKRGRTALQIYQHAHPQESPNP